MPAPNPNYVPPVATAARAASAAPASSTGVGDIEDATRHPEMGSVNAITFAEDEQDFLAKVEDKIEVQLRPNYRAEYVQRVIDAGEGARGVAFSVSEKVDLFNDPSLRATVADMYSRDQADTSDIRRGAAGDPSDDPLRSSMSPRYASAPARPLSLEENIDIVKKRMATEVGSAEGDVATSEGKMKDAERKFAELSEDIKTFKVNPFRLYENTLFAVTAALAAGLGAAAQSLSGGGPNTGLAMVNRAIEMDVLRQKHEYGALKDSAAKQATLYGQAIQLYGSDKKAVAALKAAGADMASKKATLDMHKYGIEVNQQKYVNDVLAQNFRTLMSSLAGVGGKGRGGKGEEQMEAGKRAMISAAEGFKKIIDGYRNVREKGGWLKTNFTTFVSSVAPHLLMTLTDDPDVEDIIEHQQNTKKVINTLVRSALVAGGEAGRISDPDVEQTTKEIMNLMPGKTLLFPEAELNVLEKAVTSWVEAKTGLTVEEAIKNYGEGREGVRNQARELAEYVALEKAESEKSKNASRMGVGFPYEKFKGRM
jgi:hypothetical protein